MHIIYKVQLWKVYYFERTKNNLNKISWVYVAYIL